MSPGDLLFFQNSGHKNCSVVMRLKNLDEEISHSAVSAAQIQRIVELWM